MATVLADLPVLPPRFGAAGTYRYLGSSSTRLAPGHEAYGYITELVTGRFVTAAPPPGRDPLAVQPRCDGPSALLFYDITAGSMDLQPRIHP